MLDVSNVYDEYCIQAREDFLPSLTKSYPQIATSRVAEYLAIVTTMRVLATERCSTEDELKSRISERVGASLNCKPDPKSNN